MLLAGSAAARVPRDTKPPIAPTALVATGAIREVDLRWNGSKDNVGVTAYYVYRGGVRIATTDAATRTYADRAVTPGVVYSYTIRATDAAGNISRPSNTAQASATDFPASDTEPPTVPGALAASATQTSLTLTWSASTDDVGVAGYDLYVDGVKRDSVSGLTYTYAGLTCGTSYKLGVDAYDAAANTSAPASLDARTTDCGTTASGEPMPVGDLPGWQQVFTDDFTTDAPLGSFPGLSYGPKWFAYPKTWHDTSGMGTYDAAKTVSVLGGVAKIHLHTENGVHYVAALVPKLAGTGTLSSGVPSGRLYGRYSVRFKVDGIPDYKQAWLLWPDSEAWPRDGEIDFPESRTDLASNVQAVLHHQNGTSPTDQEEFTTGQPATSWHTATTEWTAGKVAFYWDGRLIGSTTNRVPNTSMHWVLQNETQTWQSDGVIDPSTQGDILIDWVVAWRPL